MEYWKILMGYFQKIVECWRGMLLGIAGMLSGVRREGGDGRVAGKNQKSPASQRGFPKNFKN